MATIGSTARPAFIYDAETDTWVPIGSGPHTHTAYLVNSLYTAKGALVTATGTSTPATLSVGASGTFLRANSATSTGLEWADVVTDPMPQIMLLMGS